MLSRFSKEHFKEDFSGWLKSKIEYYMNNTNNCHYEIYDSITLLNSIRDNLNIVPMALEILMNTDNNFNARYFASKIIYKQIQKNSHILNNASIKLDLFLIALDFKSINKLSDLKIKWYILHSLKSTVLSNNFYKNYYEEIKKLITNQNNISSQLMLKKLDKYIQEQSNDRFNILSSLTIYLSKTKSEFKFDIFEYFPANVWNKEILLYSLLSIILENTEKWDRNAMQNFIHKIHSIDELIQEKKQYKIEHLLESLIMIQNEIQYDLEKINYLLTTLSHSNESSNCFINDYISLDDEQMKLSWLKIKCNILKISYTDEELLSLSNLLMQYPFNVLNSLFNKISPNTCISKLISFFNLLDKSEFKFMSKNDLCEHISSDDKDISYWKEQLYFYVIENIIKNEFPNYDYISVHNGSVNNCYTKYKNYFCTFVEMIYTKYCECDIVQKKKLKQLFKIDKKKELLNIIFHDLNVKLSTMVFKYHWSIQKIKKLIDSLDTENKIVQLIKTIQMIIEYNIVFQEDKEDIIFNTILQSNSINIEYNIQKIVISEIFPGTYEKNLPQLIKELIDLNYNENISILNNENSILFKYESIIKAYNDKSFFFSSNRFLNNSKPIKEWNQREISRWTSEIKKYPNKRTIDEKLIYEILAVIYRAVEVVCNFQPRDIQLLSVILILFNEKNKGRLTQIDTGEGKTIIISIIAAYYALIGHKVDIITSSSVLAISNFNSQKDFYAVLRLSSSCNSNIYNNTDYSADIIYGAVNDFQADILHQEYKKQYLRYGRKFDIAIVDEVDNMLIDGNNHIVKLSNTILGMNLLEPLLGAIYIQINFLNASIITRNGKSYFINKNEGNKEYLIKDTKMEFIKKQTNEYLRNLIRDCPESIPNDFPIIQIPKHLKDFICQVQLEKWIEQAILAIFYYANGKHYILKNDKIVVVDANNTGVVQESMQWSCGLHQFLQIKHGLKIEPESLTTNFMSNIEFFKRYSSNLYGLTGTLGSTVVKQFLNETYNVDSVIIPPFKLKQHKQLTDIIVYNENDWYNEIIKSCLLKIHNSRAVLIITNYIQETEILKKLLVKDYDYDVTKIKLYKTNDEADIINNVLLAGDILITTNIAGRGADIKVSKTVNMHGGLHVCQTFLPTNSRVEDQNKGRTARTGNPGTSQFVLLYEDKNINLYNFKSKRNIEESMFMKKALQDVKIITNKDAIFFQYCSLLNKIRVNSPCIAKNDVKNFEIMAVEERFAIWMNLHNSEIEMKVKEEILNDFQLFKDEISNDNIKNSLIKNPYLYVNIGNFYMNNRDFVMAIDKYTSAINLDGDFAEYAYFYRAYALLVVECECQKMKQFNMKGAVKDFEKTRNLIKQRESDLEILLICSDNEILKQQINNKLKLYCIQKNAIDEAIGPDIEAIDNEIELLCHDKTMKPEDMSEKIKILQKNKNNVGIITDAIRNEFEVKIEYIEIDKSFSENDILSHKVEIEEFKKNGFIGTYKITKKVNWWNAIGLCVVGAIQFIIGVVLIIFTLGIFQNIGLNILVEGIRDFLTAIIECVYKKSFTWAEWAVNKGIRLIKSLATICASAISNSLGTISHVISGVTTFFMTTNMRQDQIIQIIDPVKYNAKSKICEINGQTKELQEKINCYDVYLHLAAIYKITKTSIEVYDQDDIVKYIIGNNEFLKSIKISDKQIGYLTAIRNKISNAHIESLYCTVALQVQCDQETLKNESINFIKTHFFEVAKQACNIKRLQLYHNMANYIKTEKMHTEKNVKMKEKLIINKDGTVNFLHSLNYCSLCKCKVDNKKFVCKNNGEIFKLYNFINEEIRIIIK